MLRILIVSVIMAVFLSESCCAILAADTDPGLEEARVHLQRGRYAEAIETYQKRFAEGADKAECAIGTSRAYRAQGLYQKATSTLEQAVAKDGNNARLRAHLAEVQFQRGNIEQAQTHLRVALKVDSRQPLAKLIEADVLLETGKIRQADVSYRWFVRYYNQIQPKDAETLLLVGRGSAQYARWHSVGSVFRSIVNTVCPGVLEDDKHSWQAHLLAGQLLLEKYNRAQALPEFQKALAINPRAANVFVALANAAVQKHDFDKAEDYLDQALQINPRLVAALQLKADIKLFEGKTELALEILQRALEVNPHAQATQGRIAACYWLTDGYSAELADPRIEKLLTNLDAIDDVQLDKPNRFEMVIIKVATKNPKPGQFLLALAKTMESRRKFDFAERLYLQTIETMPQLSQPKTSLGMLYMQIGRTDDAQILLDAAFRADPFHVRVSNMRKVLKVLKGYKVVTTDHFVIHYDSKADEILARYMAEYLEEQYGPLTKYFGFEPPQRTQFEIYHNGRGLSAHKWFSARMVGLPWIQTIGASTGMIVALASPTAGADEYNWARVLKHEFVHIITLQQTKFNIPHWFTEALAVSAEGFARPAVWNTLLLQRVPKGEIRSLDTLSQAFIRPESPMDWQFAYCQSRLYAQYMTEKFGPETISKMLNAYRKGTSTRNAIKQVFGMEQELFEKGYREFLNSIVADLGDDQSEESKTFGQLEKDYKNDKQNLKAVAAYADGLMQLKRRTQARELALSVLEKDPKNPIAAIVMADLALIARSRETAAEYLIAALDRSKPHRRVLLFLAYVRSRQGDNLKAAELYGLAYKHFPHNVNAVRGLAVAYLREENYKAARPVLITLAHMDADSASVRRRLAELALDRDDYAEAIKYGKAALYVDVMDARTHRMLGDAHTGLKEHAKALREFEVALQITPRDAQIELKFVKSLRANGKTDEAKTRLQKLVQKNPSFQAAKELLESLH